MLEDVHHDYLIKHYLDHVDYPMTYTAEDIAKLKELRKLEFKLLPVFIIMLVFAKLAFY